MALLTLYEVILGVTLFFIIHYIINNTIFTTTTAGLKTYPFVGMLPELLLNVHHIHDWCTQVLQRSNLTFLFHGPLFTNMNILFTAHPDNIHYIMSSNFSNFPKGHEFNQIFDILGDGIFNSDSDSWKSQRKLALSLINHHNFHKFMVKTTQDKVEHGLIPILEHVSKQGISLDLQDLFQRFTFDSTCILVTGYNPGCLSVEFPEVVFSKALDEAEESIFYRHVVPESVWKIQRWLGIGEEKKMKEAEKVLDEKIYGYIQRKTEDFAQGIVTSNESNGVDLLTSYMNQGYSTTTSDKKFLRDTILNFMIAGRDTTSSALTWLFYLLSKNPKAVSLIREELESIPSNNRSKFNVEEINKLVYLHGAICEALRLYPPVPFQHKSPVKADTLPTGHKVGPGTKILFSLYAMGRMKEIWGEDCMEFKPERWISEKGGSKREPSYKFLAFNAGPRTCVGKEVALIQVKTVAAAMIHNYDVKVVEEEDEGKNGPNVSIILQRKHGLKVKVIRRWED